MAVTITKTRVDSFKTEAGARMLIGEFTILMDASYPTGGEPVDLSPWFRTIFAVNIEKAYTANKLGFNPEIDPTNYGVGAFALACANGAVADVGEAETTNTTNLATVLLNATVQGWGY